MFGSLPGGLLLGAMMVGVPHHVVRFVCIALAVPMLARRLPRPAEEPAASARVEASGVDRGED